MFVRGGREVAEQGRSVWHRCQLLPCSAALTLSSGRSCSRESTAAADTPPHTAAPARATRLGRREGGGRGGGWAAAAPAAAGRAGGWANPPSGRFAAGCWLCALLPRPAARLWRRWRRPRSRTRSGPPPLLVLGQAVLGRGRRRRGAKAAHRTPRLPFQRRKRRFVYSGEDSFHFKFRDVYRCSKPSSCAHTSTNSE